ncbi:MAG: ABC transporter substrate-binding protein [Bacteriovorax sp.]|nr:ABC transporter substrate-binding protein [Bacteriovorax sp.]
MKLIQVFIMLIGLMSGGALQAVETINVAISAAPNSMTPFYSTDANSQNINRLIHSSLVDFNDSMQFVCVACETFTDKMSTGKQIVTFKLRQDLTFSDGTKVSAADVKKSFEYFARDEKIKSTFIGTFESIENVNVIDDHTVEFVYKNFSLENVSNLSLLKIVKLKNGSRELIEPMDVIGCGEYVLKNIHPLEILVEPRKVGKPVLVFKVVKDETTLALKIINKEIDLSVANMSPRKIFWMKSRPGIKVWNIPSANYQFMGINHKRDLFKDVRVRKAFSLLIPRDDLLKYKLKDTAVLSTGLFSPTFGEMYDKGDVEKYDVEAARKLLAEAGWKKSKKGFLEKDGKQMEIDWKVSNNKASIEVVEVLQHFFEQEGMIVNVSIQEWGTYMAAFKTGKFDIVIGQWVGFTGPDILKYAFHSTNTPPKGGNRIGYNNPALDAVLDEATIETDPVKRTALYKHALQMVNSDYGYINLWHPNIIWIGRSCLSDIKLESSGSFYPLKTLEKNCGK